MWQRPDPLDVASKLRSGAHLSSDERELLADLAETEARRRRKRSEIDEEKSIAVATHVMVNEAKFGLKKEAAVAAAQEEFNLSRSQVQAHKKKWRSTMEKLRMIFLENMGKGTG